MGLLLFFAFQNLFSPKSGVETVILHDYNEFLRMLDQNKFVSVQVTPDSDGTIAIVAIEKVEKKDEKGNSSIEEKKYVVTALADPKLIEKLTSKPQVKFIPTKQPSNWFGVILGWVLPVVLFFLLWSFLMKRQMGGGMGGGQIMNFGKSRAKLLQQNGARVTFNDVAGAEEAKKEVREVVEFLKDPQKFTKLGGRLPKGYLLIGPPGTGKTLLARAVAGEANVPFFNITGSDFVEIFVGVGASRVRDLFAEGKKNAPCIVFIDELDAVARSRGVGLIASNDEREQTLNQLLSEMDGFETAKGVIVMAATNRPEVLDKAILRPGRFDRQIMVPRPDVKGREAILKVHAKKIKLAEEVDLSIVARGTPGASGADLESIVNEAALLAARDKKEAVSLRDLELAKDKIFMGDERKSLVLSAGTKRTIAYHEAGHTLVAKFTEGADPVNKVSIIPRGMALGVTQQLPVEDKHLYTKKQVEDMLAILMGGRLAEKICLGDISTGAENDIARATELAENMVKRWGMSETLGPIKWGKESEHPFLGSQIVDSHQGYSEEMAKAIDGEVRGFIEKARQSAQKIISENRSKLEALADALLEKETLDGAEIDEIIKG